MSYMQIKYAYSVTSFDKAMSFLGIRILIQGKRNLGGNAI